MQQGFEALIRRADQADREAADKLFAILYSELRRIAERNLRRAGSSLTLGTTTLLHEAYLNIAERENVAFADRPRFLAYASRAMRGLVIDYARSGEYAGSTESRLAQWLVARRAPGYLGSRPHDGCCPRGSRAPRAVTSYSR